MIKLLIPIVVVLLLAGGGGAAWYMKLGPFAKPAVDAPPPEPGTLQYAMPERIVNLADKAGYRYLKVKVSLEFVDSAHKPGELKGEALTNQQALLGDDLARFSATMDDFMTTTLSTKSAAELLTPEGKEHLRSQLLSGFKSRVPEPSLRAVYFTEFVIQ